MMIFGRVNLLSYRPCFWVNHKMDSPIIQLLLILLFDKINLCIFSHVVVCCAKTKLQH